LATEPPRLRAVFDTNVVVAALMSRNPSSPNVELMGRWVSGELVILYSSALRAEYAEKLAARAVEAERGRQFLQTLDQHGNLIEVSPSDIIPIIAADPDDDLIVACAVKGDATYIITYDPHFDLLGGSYRGIQILRPLNFLYLIRGDAPPKP
jgi:uncharacterized protein